MKAKYALAVLSLVFCVSTAWAEQDFYGIQMRDELWALNLVLHSGPKADDNDLLEGPVLDHQVFAEALVRLAEDGTEFMLNVVNQSPRAIPTEYDSRDFMLHLNNGKTVPLIDLEAEKDLVIVAPKKSVKFMPSLGNLRIRPEEIKMIEVSFDLGRTRLFLFPASNKTKINALREPEPLVVKPSRGGKKPGGFMEWMTGKHKASKVPSADPGGSATRDRVDGAIRDFKYVPTPAPSKGAASSALARKEKAIDEALVLPREAPAASVRTEAKVLEFNGQFNYVTVNLGARDGLYRDMLLNILRNGKLVARARVRQLRDEVAAAAILPEYRQPDIRPGDLVAIG